MKECPKCKNKISNNAKFCMNCGFSLQKHKEDNEKHFCPECGTEFTGGHFCPECGYDISPDLKKKSKSLTNDLDINEIDKLLSDKISKTKENESLSAFEYSKYPTGGYIIKKYIDKVETDVVLPESIIGIEAGAFENTLVTSVKLNSKLKFIGKRAFANCKHLEVVAIPSSVSRIDDEAFINCVKLDIVLPKSIQIMGKDIIKNTLGEILAIERAEKERINKEKKAKEEALKKEEAKRLTELAKIEAEIAKIKKQEEEAKKLEEERLAKIKAEEEKRKKEEARLQK